MKLNSWKFALAGGICIGAWSALMTLAALMGVTGALTFANWIAQFAGPYGYSISWGGVFLCLIIGFIKGYIAFGIFAWLYNILQKK